MEVAAAAAGRMGRRRREGPGNARGGRGLERESGSGAVRARGGPLKRRRAWPQPAGEGREGGRGGSLLLLLPSAFPSVSGSVRVRALL